ncbi:hypothetical protein EJ04DRAFT_569283 [Polyplosphaeria fusca]|uniref:Uncharacterized protein n=1 Tax=Polyplosphaeria fusca TaxID=682080 RepID=A0A9P4QPV5_9PLEO|nr:hypothetical protein EJ04DRAFT_569283 [Polyplosphaeria fusca]
MKLTACLALVAALPFTLGEKQRLSRPTAATRTVVPNSPHHMLSPRHHYRYEGTKYVWLEDRWDDHDLICYECAPKKHSKKFKCQQTKMMHCGEHPYQTETVTEGATTTTATVIQITGTPKDQNMLSKRKHKDDPNATRKKLVRLTDPWTGNKICVEMKQTNPKRPDQVHTIHGPKKDKKCNKEGITFDVDPKNKDPKITTTTIDATTATKTLMTRPQQKTVTTYLRAKAETTSTSSHSTPTTASSPSQTSPTTALASSQTAPTSTPAPSRSTPTTSPAPASTNPAPEDSEAVFDRAYERGFDKGYSKGYLEGYNDGWYDKAGKKNGTVI